MTNQHIYWDSESTNPYFGKQFSDAHARVLERAQQIKYDREIQDELNDDYEYYFVKPINNAVQIDSKMFIKNNPGNQPRLHFNLTSSAFDAVGSNPVSATKAIKKNDGSFDFIISYGNKPGNIGYKKPRRRNPAYNNYPLICN